MNNIEAVYTARFLYFDLLKSILTLSMADEEYLPINTRKFSLIKKFVYKHIEKYLTHHNICLIRKKIINPDIRRDGRDHPQTALSMIGLKRMDNIQFCIEDVLSRNIPGDVIETGVWRGGAVIFMRAILKAYGIKDRKVWVADSFEGLPSPNKEKYPADVYSKFHLMNHLAISLDQVKTNFQKFGLLDEQVCFLKGWFKDTLPKANISCLSLMRLDGDMYESTMDALENLYPKLSSGGYVIIDDYWDLEPCKLAVDDFRMRENIDDEIKRIDWTAIYWTKSK